MLEAAVTAFGGGSIVTAVLTIFIKLWDRKQEADQQKSMMLAERSRVNVKALDALARRTNNFWGNATRFILAMVPQVVMLALLWIGYNDPDTVIWYGQQNEPTTVSILFGLFEIESPKEITWSKFNGIVIIPALFAQMGAVNAYFLVGGMFNRR
ncbi:MAG: hypothetical protein MI745_14015 [Pseudomonadales bacterium]|nr:hypothetical protein [Pseudomonadales bacterium]